MKRFALLLALSSTALFAQSPAPTLPSGGLPPPEKAPSQSPAPAPSETPSHAPAPAATPKKSSPAQTDSQNPIDALTVAEVQQALTLLKSKFVHADQLTDDEMERAKLQGLIARLSPGASILVSKPNPAPSVFHSEMPTKNIGYLRLGSLSKTNLDELSSALKNLSQSSVSAAVLDLRATPASSDYEDAAAVLEHFCAKGKTFFTLEKPAENSAQKFAAKGDPDFSGVLVVLVDHETAGAAEAIAAVLRAQAHALIVGEKTQGQALEFSDLPLEGGEVLRVALAEVALPDGASYSREGVKPDITASTQYERAVLEMELQHGVLPMVAETARPHMNEAALVAGANPEIDAFEAAQREKPTLKPMLRDVQLQRALDLLTTIRVYEKSSAEKK